MFNAQSTAKVISERERERERGGGDEGELQPLIAQPTPGQIPAEPYGGEILDFGGLRNAFPRIGAGTTWPASLAYLSMERGISACAFRLRTRAE